MLYERLYHTFCDIRKRKCSVNDADLRDWARAIAHDIGMHAFKASSTWIAGFKKHFRICSRKITKFVSRSFARDEESILQLARDFVETAKSKFVKYQVNAVYNANQSGFEREMCAKQTLSFVGEKHTEIAVLSINALTHSYTIMPVIALDGTLLPVLYICLQEPHGNFGPHVKKTMVMRQINWINAINASTPDDDIELYRDLLSEALAEMRFLDDAVQ